MSADRNQKSLIAFVTNNATALAVETWCNEAGLESFEVIMDPKGEMSAQEQTSSARVLIVEIDTPDGPSLHRVESFAQANSQRSKVLALVHQPSPSDVRRLFHNGVSDVLSTPVDPGELRAALDRALQSSGMESVANSRKGKLFTVLGSAGGVGVTTTAINLAREFVNFSYPQTAIIDLDLQFGALDTALDTQTRLNFTDAIRAGERLDVTMLRSMMTRHASGFDIMAASKSIAPLDVISVDFASEFARTLKSAYDCVILDMPSAWSPWFRSILAETDVIIPVVEPSVRSAEGVRRIMDAIRDMELGTVSLSPIVNRSQLFPSSKDRIQHLMRQLNVSKVSSIRSDDKVFLLASDMGACVRDVAETSAPAAEFAAAAQTLLATAGLKPAAVDSGGKRGKSKFSMFRSNA